MTVNKEWEHVKSFQDGICLVRVTMIPGFRPRYSIQIGRANEDGGIIQFFGVFIDTKLSKCALRESIAESLSTLIKQAEAWILEQCQTREDEILEAKIQKEEASANQGKPSVKHTGKTERDRVKATG